MSETFTETISDIERVMAEEWLPAAYEPLAARMEEARGAVRDLIIKALGQKQTHALIRPEMLDPAAQRRVAAQIASASIFRKRIPEVMAALRLALIDLERKAARGIYEKSSLYIVKAFNDHTPEGVNFKWAPRAGEMNRLDNIFVDGRTWAQTLALLFRAFPQQLKAVVNQQIADHGRTIDVQTAILARFDGMWNTLEKQTAARFDGFGRWGYKLAEINLREVVKG